MFYDLLDSKAITYNGPQNKGSARAEVARMIKAYFVDKDGKPLTDDYIEKVLKTQGRGKENTTGKAKIRIDIKNLIPHIKKTEES